MLLDLLLARAIDLLSPPTCAACDALLRGASAAFCKSCATTIDTDAPLIEIGDMAGVAVGTFGGALATAIRHLKYDDRPDLARPLGDLLGHACLRAGVSVDMVVPVPLHITRLARRGYNQAGLLATRVGRLLGSPMHPRVLVRQLSTATQARLSRSSRWSNVACAFDVAQPGSVRRRRILIVDDVATTGATLLSCATALRRSGAASVRAAVVAHTPIDEPHDLRLRSHDEGLRRGHAPNRHRDASPSLM